MRRKFHSRKMQGTKLIIVAAFALCTLQSNGAEIPKSADKIDLRLFVENGAAIAKNLFRAVNIGLDESKPNIEKMLNELAPEAKTLIGKVIDDTRIAIKNEEKRVNHVVTVLTKALNDLKPIKPCSDKISPRAKKLALTTEKQLAKIVQDVEKKYKNEIDDIKVGAKKTLEKARTLFDVEVSAVVKCLSPGRKNANECLENEADKVLTGISDIAIDTVLLFQTVNDSLSPIVPEVLEKMAPVFQKVLTDGKALIKELSDCIATLK